MRRPRRFPCGGWFARGTKPHFERTDQGEDRSVKRGAYVRAPGDGYVVNHLSDGPFPGGFGSPYAVVKITTGRFAVGDGVWYIGHANADVLPIGTHFKFGDKLARTDNGFFADQGWVEIGKCVDGLPGPDGTGARYHKLFRSVWRVSGRTPKPLPPVPKPPIPPKPEPHHHKKHKRPDVLGTAIDVSEAQGDVDWPKVARKGLRKGLRKRAVKVGICKATEGRDWTDGRFSGARLKAIAKAGLAVGVYHFARPDNNKGRFEAQHFVRTVKAAGGHFISYQEWREGKSGVFGFLDFETAPYDKAFAIEFAEEFEKLTGCDLGIYGGGYSLNPVLAALKHFACVWLAAYVTDWDPYFDGPSASVKLWQNKDNWRCPGISGNVDHSVYLG